MAGPRRAIVGVMGSGEADRSRRAVDLGAWLATQGVHLLTGAGGGVMKSVSQAFRRVQSRPGLVLGIVPGEVRAGSYQPAAGYPNEDVEVAIFTHLPLSGASGGSERSRNHVNVLTADIVIALPGGAGTSSEVRLALQYGRPLICYLKDRVEIPDLPEETCVVSTLGEVQDFVRARLAERR